MTKEPRIHNGERIISSINGLGKIKQPHTKERNWTQILHHTQKINSNCIKDLNIRPEMMKLPEENIGSNLL